MYVLQNELDSAVKEYDNTEVKATMFVKQVTSLESQLADAQEMAQEETRVKLNLQSSLRQAEEQADKYLDQMEEEESQRKSLESKVSVLNAQVSLNK